MNTQAKRLFSALLAVVMLFSVLPVGSALAANSGTCGESLTWTLDDSGTLTIGGTGEMENAQILVSPESETVKAVVIEDGVTSIGETAFRGFTALESVTVPKSVTKIGGNAFIGCYALTGFTVDEGNPAYSSANGVLFNKDKTTLVMYPAAKTGEFSVPDSVAAIDLFALFGCSGLTGFTVGEGNTVYSSLNGVLFSKDGETLILYPFGRPDEAYSAPDGVKEIAAYAFGGCKNLKRLTIPGSVETIGDSAFSVCTGLKDVTIFEGVKTIGHDTFYRCTSLESITLPNSITKTGENVFDRCTSLKNVTLSEGLTRIEKNLFSECTSLESFSIPKNITEIGVDVFDKCTGLKSVTADENNVAFSSEDGVLFNKDKTSLVIYPEGKNDKTYVIPNGVTKIEFSAFSRCENLTDVIFPDGVAEIERYAFARCKNLTSVTFPNGLKKINERAFFECDKLERVIFSSTVENIGYSSFASCGSLNDVVIPAGVKTVNAYAFNNCRSLTSVTIQGKDVSIGNNAFGYYINPETGSLEKISGFTLSGHSGSSAKKYAEKNGFSFFDLGATHSYEAKVTKTATCTVDGEVVYTCTCGDTYTQIIPASGHSPVTIPEIAPTCTEEGKTEGKRCASCGEILVKQNVISALGHTPIVTAKAVAPTCTESGKTAEIKCSACGEVVSRQTEVAPLGHTLVVTTKAVAPTCTKDGKTEGAKCSTCGEVIKVSKTVKATGHKYKTTTVKATLKKNGSTTTKCTVCNAVKSKSTVARVSSVKLSKTSLTYNGKTQKPTVVVKDSQGKTLKNGTDYTVKYSKGCKNVGQYTVTVTFKGNYSGTKTLTFKIVPKGTSISKLSAGEKKFTAKWKKQSTQTTGYELQYSTKSNLKKAKTVDIGKAKTTSSTVKKLKEDKKYYVRVRTYKIVKLNGKSVKLYSSWSKVKSIRTK